MRPKQLVYFLAALTLAFALSGCIFVLGGLQISNASFETNYWNGDQRNPTYYVCDNKTTLLGYSFRYNDPTLLAGWDSYLKGFATKDEAGFASFNANDPRNDTSNRTVTVTYNIPARTAPLSLFPQAIVVNPTPVPSPSIIGRTYVVIKVRPTAGSDRIITLGPAYVIDNCP
ncbi:MAG: hypothetical protein NZN28_13900 [Meiothermus sp.]|uniref:hypothetical protein n=1 Tax=Meiothermus sp. TaxID=1955249 RepID=UPI0025D65D8B|nr:hypothetical protein [Meiothermus sp.]MCS7069704.1 hypothetical protein [Meiothermus sp.]